MGLNILCYTNIAINSTYGIIFLSCGIWIVLLLFFKTLNVFKYQTVPEFPILNYLILCFSLTIMIATDFALLFICLEGLSLILYIIATLGRLQGGITAATKYFAFGTAGSLLILWGIVHIYELLSSLSLKVLFYATEHLDILSMNIGFKMEWAGALIILGLLIKLGAAPIHQWVPDVYAGVPIFITTIYAIFIKFVLFIIFIYFAYYFNVGNEIEYAACLSLIVGCFGAIRQQELKRFLAYGSITHVGFLLSGDLVASMVYLLTYVIATFLFFSVLLSLRLNDRELVYLSDLRYILSTKTQWYSTLLIFSLGSIAGLPPFAGFYGKILIWSSLLEDIYLFNDIFSYVVLLVNLIVSLLIIFYYARLMVYIYLGGETIATKVLECTLLFQFAGANLDGFKYYL